MILNINQTKLVGLTMKLDLKTRDYKLLCEKIDKLKEAGIEENDERLIKIKEDFEKNYQEIVQIKKELMKIQ